jgi:hypothetical protein
MLLAGAAHAMPPCHAEALEAVRHPDAAAERAMIERQAAQRPLPEVALHPVRPEPPPYVCTLYAERRCGNELSLAMSRDWRS